MACAIVLWRLHSAGKATLVAGACCRPDLAVPLVTAPTADDVVDYVADGLWVCGIALLALTYSAERRRAPATGWVMAGQLASPRVHRDFRQLRARIPGLLQQLTFKPRSRCSRLRGCTHSGARLHVGAAVQGPVRAGPSWRPELGSRKRARQ